MLTMKRPRVDRKNAGRSRCVVNTGHTSLQRRVVSQPDTETRPNHKREKRKASCGARHGPCMQQDGIHTQSKRSEPQDQETGSQTG